MHCSLLMSNVSMAFFYGENFFLPLIFAKSCIFVPKIIFLRIWRQWRSVARTLAFQEAPQLQTAYLVLLAVQAQLGLLLGFLEGAGLAQLGEQELGMPLPVVQAG